jgi:hypothetical protein
VTFSRFIFVTSIAIVLYWCSKAEANKSERTLDSKHGFSINYRKIFTFCRFEVLFEKETFSKTSVDSLKLLSLPAKTALPRLSRNNSNMRQLFEKSKSKMSMTIYYAKTSIFVTMIVVPGLKSYL